jgi:hypothetical protein
MTKGRSAALIVCIAVALAMVLVPTAGAGPWTAASGNWTWVNNSIEFTDVGNGCQSLTGDENGTWKGTFAGVSHEDFFGVVIPDGSMGGALTSAFKGSVKHTKGTMVMHIDFWAPFTSLFMGGSWKIVSGAGGLSHLRGQGTWVSLVDAENTPLSAATYEGKIRLK